MGYGSPPRGAPGPYPAPGYPPYPGAPPPRPRRPMRRRLFFPSVLLFVAAAITLTTLGLTWYQTSLTSSSGQNLFTEQFGIAGGCISGSDASSGSSCASYSSAGVSGVASLYETVEALVVLGGLMAIVGGIFGLLAGLGYPLFRHQVMIGLMLAIVAAILVLLAPIALATGQPTAISSSTVQTAGPCGGTGPQSSFFGSCTSSTGSETFSWGPEAGWYLGFFAFMISLCGGFLLRSGQARHDHEDRVAEEYSDSSVRVARARTNYPSPPSAYPGGAPAPNYSAIPYGPATAAAYPPPTPAPGYGVPIAAAPAPCVAGPPGVVCANCGTVNPPGALFCGRCQQKLA